jgi:hypothetical protein
MHYQPPNQPPHQQQIEDLCVDCNQRLFGRLWSTLAVAPKPSTLRLNPVKTSLHGHICVSPNDTPPLAFPTDTVSLSSRRGFGKPVLFGQYRHPLVRGSQLQQSMEDRLRQIHHHHHPFHQLLQQKSIQVKNIPCPFYR